MSIKNEGFSVPVVWLERYENTFGTGANQPVLCSGIYEGTEDSGEFVVKLLASERMSNEACFRELVAALIAIELGIRVVNPVIVNIDEDFSESLIGKECFQRIKDSIGLNFGSKYLGKGYRTIVKDEKFDDNLLEKAKDVFWFDMFLQNVDRTFTKPNLLTNGKDLVMLDHELAFSFLFLLGGGEMDPWNVTREKWPNFSDLILPTKLKNATFNEQSIADKIGLLDNEFWDCVSNFIPAEWANDDYLQRIIDHVNRFNNRVGDFVTSLQILLA